MKYVSVFFSVVFFLCLNIKAQQHLADSIGVLLQQKLTDSAKANNMIMQGMYYESVDTGKAHAIYQSARKFAAEKKLNYFISRSWQFEGFLYNLQGDNIKAIVCLQNALPFAQKSNRKDFQLLYAKLLGNLGNYYLDAGDVKNALYYDLKKLTVTEVLQTTKVAEYINISNIYLRMDDPENAKKYVYKALDIAEKHGAKDEIFQAHIFISLFYGQSENFIESKKHIDTARFFRYCSYDELEKVTNADYAYNAFEGFFLATAEAFEHLNADDSAIVFYNKAYDLALQRNVPRDMTAPRLKMGEIYLKQRKYETAAPLLLKSLQDAVATQNMNAITNSNKLLSQLYAETGSFEKAYNYLKQYNIAQDSIEGIEKKKYLKDIETKYETEKKEQQLKLQTAETRQERIWKYILAAALLLLLVIIFLVRRGYKNRQQLLEKEKELQQQQIIQLENEKQLAATQAVLKGQEEERSRLAKDLHDGLGGILSSAKYSFNSMKQTFILSEDHARVFEKSMNMLDESISELRRVAHNMMPETLMKLSLNEALQDYCQQITESSALPVTYQSFGMEELQVDNAVKTTVYRIVQELTYNIIKHAKASSAMVQVMAKADVLNITVEDDGVGFDTQILEQAAGIGYKNTLSRVSFLKGVLDIQSKTGEGTSVYIEIPLHQ